MLRAIFEPHNWATVPFHFWSVVFFVLGSIVGSFLNVCIHRLPLGQSVVSPPSHCPHCQYSIPWYLNVPLITWLYLRGKCRNCGAPISIRYFLVELLTGFMFLACWLSLGRISPPLALIYSIFLAGLIVATFIDFEYFIIPDEITIGGMVVGFICSFLMPVMHGVNSLKAAMQQSLLGMVVGAGTIYFIVRLGKLLFGRLRLDLDPGSRVHFGETGLELPPKQLPLEDCLRRSSGWLAFRAEKVELIDRCLWDVLVGVSANKIIVGTESFDVSAAPYLEAIVARVLSPHETARFADVPVNYTGLLPDWSRPLLGLVQRRFRSRINPGAHLVFTDARLRLRRDRIPFEDVFYRKTDAVAFTARRVETQFRSWTDAQVRLTRDELSIGGESFHPEAVPRMDVVVDGMVLPREAMGLGDVKFMAAIGAFLGWQAVIFSLVLSSFIGAIVGIVLIATGRRGWRLAYGPYIALAAAIWLFAGPELVGWYWHLMESLMRR